MIKGIFIVCMALSAIPMLAQTSFDDVIRSVLSNNMGVQSQIATEEASVENARAENSLDGLSAGFEHVWSSIDGETKWSASVSQEFQYPGIYRARSQANELNTQALEYVRLSILSDKALAVKLLVLDVVNAQARLDFYVEIGENLRQINQLISRSYELGNATILDVRKMQLAVMDNDRQIAACRADIESLVASLRGMGAEIDVNNIAWNKYPVQALNSPSINPEDYYDYHIGTLRAEASMASARAIKLSAVPSFSLGYKHAFEGGKHFNGLSFSIKLPSYSQKQRRHAAELEATSLASDFNDRLSVEMAEAVGMYNSAMQLRSSLEDYRQLSGDNTYLELLKRAYDGGELTIIDYLNEVNLFSSARMNFIELEYRYNLFLARLNRYKALEFN